MVNSSQSIVAAYRYDPYGNTISSSGTLASANLYRFSSKEVDVNYTDSGLYYYGYRWYDPNLQRWLNRDPIREQGFLIGRLGGTPRDEQNLYLFVNNSPYNILDPLGLKSKPSGVKICREPGLGGHVWLEYPGGSVGFYPGDGGIWPGGPGTIVSPDPHAQDKNRKCKEGHIPDCTDKTCFQDCIKKLKDAAPHGTVFVGEHIALVGPMTITINV